MDPSPRRLAVECQAVDRFPAESAAPFETFVVETPQREHRWSWVTTKFRTVCISQSTRERDNISGMILGHLAALNRDPPSDDEARD
jgi:hypothetical protein